MEAKLTRTALIAALVASLIGCALFAYLWIDRSISLSYLNQSIDASNVALRRLEDLLGNEWSGMLEKSVLEKLQAEAVRHPNEKIVIKKENDVIWFDEIRFSFEQGRLKKIDGS